MHTDAQSQWEKVEALGLQKEKKLDLQKIHSYKEIDQQRGNCNCDIFFLFFWTMCFSLKSASTCKAEHIVYLQSIVLFTKWKHRIKKFLKIIQFYEVFFQSWRIFYKKDSGGLQIKINKYLWLTLLKVNILNIQQVQFARV